MRSAFAKLLLAGLLLVGCEDGKPVTAPPAAESPPAQPAAETPPPAAAAAAESPTPPAVRPPHGATGVGDTAPAAEREPPKGSVPPAPTEWGKPGLPRPPELEGRRPSSDAGVAPDAGR